MRFESWGFLFILGLLLALSRFWYKQARPPRVKFPIAIPDGVARRNPVLLLFILKALGIAALILAFARPQTSFKQTERRVSGIDIMLLMDVSKSMDIEDLGDESRIDIAKKTMKEFIKGRQNDRIGFAMFSGEPVTKAPPTLDYGILLNAIDEASTEVLKDGTAIGDGLALAVNRLRNSKAKSKIVILVTDGDNNLGQIDPATAGEIAAGYGIRVYTIAIGREGRVKMPIVHQNGFGQKIVTYQWFDNALNPELLQLIAKTTNGKFYRVTDENALQSVFKEIDQLEKSDFNTKEKTRYDEVFEWPLKLALLLLLGEQILSYGLWRVFA